MRQCALYILLACFAITLKPVHAALQNVPLNDDSVLEPKWITSLEANEIVVQENFWDVAYATLHYRFSNGLTGRVRSFVSDTDPPSFTFLIPVGDFDLTDTFHYNIVYPLKDFTATTVERSIPVGFAEELDITGEAAEVLLYPLPDDNYIARYIPCCNIYGGMTYAARVPVNPTETDEGLPAHLVSPFIVLEPDGMSASTMGLYLDMKYDPESFPGKVGRVALYELNLENTWSEVITYAVDSDKRVVTTHCPEGGSFVLAWVKD